MPIAIICTLDTNFLHDEINMLPLYTRLKPHKSDENQNITHSTFSQSIQQPDKRNKLHSTATNTAHTSKRHNCTHQIKHETPYTPPQLPIPLHR